MSDLISREATIADLHTADIPDEWMEWMESFINAQPSVEQERPHGKWIEYQDRKKQIYAECSNCGFKNYAGILNYCPECGSEMKGEHT